MTGLKEHFSYDEESGEITRKKSKGRATIGSIRYTKTSHGYLSIPFDNTHIYAHRLAWALYHGVYPELHIDHINGIRTDNRISNLRLATKMQNGQNQRKPHSNNTSGYMGVRKHSETKWTAYIVVNKVKQYLGSFKTGEDASAAYLAAKRERHEFNQI